MCNCKDCMYHCKREDILYCSLNHYFPRKEVIAFMGCVDFSEEKINLLNWREEDGNGKEEKQSNNSIDSRRDG